MSKKYDRIKDRIKFMDIINEMQAFLTKLRREAQRSEAGKAGEYRGFRESPTVSGIIEEDTPDLPLHVRVAKEIGWRHCCLDRGIDEWMGYAPNFLQSWSKIPDYPNDRDAAMEAFDLYFELQCRKIDNHFDYWIERFYKDGWKWKVRLGFADKSVVADSLEKAFCEAIVAHSEGK